VLEGVPTDSIQFGSITELRTRAHKRVDQLKAQGVKAELYGADPDGALGGLNSFYLLVTSRRSTVSRETGAPIAQSGQERLVLVRERGGARRAGARRPAEATDG